MLLIERTNHFGEGRRLVETHLLGVEAPVNLVAVRVRIMSLQQRQSCARLPGVGVPSAD